MTQPDPVTIYNPSALQCAFPDEFGLIGLPDQPVAIFTPDGWRTYPGATQNVYQWQPDGTWKKVLYGSDEDATIDV